MLHEFPTSNFDELVWALRGEAESPASQRGANAVEISRTAALHGKALREQGYTAGQVVQDYADISSAIADAVASYGGLTKSRALFARP